MKSNENGNYMVEHHTHYKEIDGYDETVWMEAGAHKALHHKLRTECKCNIPVNDLKKISMAANGRSQKSKDDLKKYRSNIQHLDFNETPGKNTRGVERISYNNKVGTISYSAFFCGMNGYVLPIINI